MRLKRLYSFILTLCLLISLVPMPARAAALAEGTCGTSLTWVLGEDGTLTVSGTGAMTNYGSIDNQDWAAYRDQITAVVIESGVTSIGQNAFNSCTNLQSATIASTVTTIYAAAFSNCTALGAIAIPEGVATMKANIFYGCTSLSKVTLPVSLKSMDGHTFYNCSLLKTAGPIGGGYNIEFAWTDYIRQSAFNAANCLESVVLPAGLTGLYNHAFAYCEKLTSVAIPYTVTTIGNGVFNSSGVTAVYFNNTTTSIKFLDGASFGSAVTMYYPEDSTYWANVVSSGSGVYSPYTSYCVSINGDNHFDIVTASQDATCTTGGYIDYHCYMCGYDHTVELEVKPHTEGAAVTENYVAATCTVAGSYDTVAYCMVCGQELSRENVTIPALGHTPKDPVQENYVAATCEKEGSYDEVVYCDVCKEELSRISHTIPVAEHAPGEAVEENRVEATCTEDGSYDMVVYCTVCGEELSRESFVIPAHGHIESEAVQENYVAPTCETDGGYDMVVYCATCGTELSREHTTLSAIGHDWDEGKITTEPTCTEKGIKTFTCQNDSTHTYTEPVDELGHTPGEAVEENRVEATCTEDGSYDMVVYCTVCGEELSRESFVVSAHGHIESEAVQENYVAPTCEAEGGYDMVVYCETCGAELSRIHMVLDAIGHAWDEGKVTTEPTCTEKGIKTFTCQNDSTHTYTAPVDALGHAPGEAVEENRVEATCTEAGSYDMVVYCTVCGEELSSESFVIPAHGHTEAEAVQENYVAPTCETDGGYDMVVYCATCGAELSRAHTTLSAIGHDWDEGKITTEPTCTEKGIKTYTCKNDSTHTYTEPVDALGHTPGEAVEENRVEATCTEDGSYDM